MTRVSMTFAAASMTISLAQAAQPAQTSTMTKEALVLMAVLQERANSGTKHKIVG